MGDEEERRADPSRTCPRRADPSRNCPRRCCNCFYGWPVVIASGVAIITSFPATPSAYLQRELGLTKSEMGLVWGAAILVTAAFLPLAGKLVDRQGPWRVLFVCTFGLGLSVYVFVGLTHPPQCRPTSRCRLTPSPRHRSPPPSTNSANSLRSLVAQVPVRVSRPFATRVGGCVGQATMSQWMAGHDERREDPPPAPSSPPPRPTLCSSNRSALSPNTRRSGLLLVPSSLLPRPHPLPPRPPVSPHAMFVKPQCFVPKHSSLNSLHPC